MSDNTLFQNMEILKEKFKISYKEAKEVLESHDNDLIESLIFLEGVYPDSDCCQLKLYLDTIKNKVVDLYKEGSNQRMIISRKGEEIADIPLTAVVVSLFTFVLYPILIPIKLGGILLLDIDFKIVDKSGKVYHVNSDVKEKMDYVFSTSKGKINDIISNTDIKSTADEFKSKAIEFGKKAMENFNGIIENKISKSIKDKTLDFDYAKFVYDSENDEIKEEYNYEDEKELNNEEENEDISVEVSDIDNEINETDEKDIEK